MDRRTKRATLRLFLRRLRHRAMSHWSSRKRQFFRECEERLRPFRDMLAAMLSEDQKDRHNP